MPTNKAVFLKIKEISSKYLSGNPPLNIYNIALELQTNIDLVRNSIVFLEAMGLVIYDSNDPEIIFLTENGKTCQW